MMLGLGLGLGLSLSLGGVTPAAAQTAVGTQLDAADEQVLPKIYSTYGNFLAARKAELRDDTAAAAAYYRRVLERDPDNAEVLNRAYFFTGVEGDVEAAAQLARRLLIARPGDLLSPIVIATDMIAQDQVQDAVDLLSSVDQTGLNAFLVPVMLAWALAEQGETDKALVALDELKATDGVSGLRLLHTALVLDHAGRAEDAQAAFMAYADAQGDQATLRAIQLVGGYFVRNGQPDQAQAIAQRYTERFPDSLLVADATKGFADGDPPPALVVDARTGFAEVFYGTATLMLDSDPQTASLFSHLGLSLAPNFALTRLLLGQILSDRKQYLASEAIYRAISDDPNLHLAAGLAIADNQRAREEIDAAASTLQALAETYPDRPDPLIELGDLYRYEERFEESEVAYTAALERIPEPARRHWAVYFGRGITYERTKRWPLAEEDFKVALSLEPDQPFVLNYLGYSWVDQGVNILEAKEMIQTAVNLRPRDGFIIDSLGWAYYRLGEFDEAVKYLERAVRATPDDPTINDHLGDAYWQVGRRLEAGFLWKRALDMAEEEELIDSIQQKLENGLPEQTDAPNQAAE